MPSCFWMVSALSMVITTYQHVYLDTRQLQVEASCVAFYLGYIHYNAYEQGQLI